MEYAIQCRCGTVRGALQQPWLANRCVCYCADCQAFARFLGQQDTVLNPMGGTEILQVPPDTVTLTEGLDYLACMRLTENGLLRWYADCCHTPIGNTPANRGLAFVGLIHSCFEQDKERLTAGVSPVRTSPPRALIPAAAIRSGILFAPSPPKAAPCC